MGRQRCRYCSRCRRQETSEKRVLFRKSNVARKRTDPDWHAKTFGQRDNCRTCTFRIDFRSDHQYRTFRTFQCTRKRRKQIRIWRRIAADNSRRNGIGLRAPVIHWNGNKRRPARPLHSEVIGLCEGRRHVFGARRLATPFDIGLGKVRGFRGAEERLHRQKTTSLLPGRDYEGHLIPERRENASERMSDTDSRVQVAERGSAGGACIPIRHRHNRCFL